MNKLLLMYMSVFFLLISCSSVDGNIVDKKWFLLEIEGDSNIVIINDKKPYLEFDLASSKIGGNASCNNFFTDYQIEGNVINLGLMATTMMACPNVSNQEYRFLQALNRIETFQIINELLYFYEGEEAILIFSSVK